ncbi:RNA ligase/cyclic nucleotide phosphodiesterase [Mycena sanguinolenta]|nr:RNA ligase/cyclic nucleotide phosphodiesterase [Mycena sanguinolenta]
MGRRVSHNPKTVVMTFPLAAAASMLLLVSFGGYLFHFAMTPGPEMLKLGFEDPKYPPGVPSKFDADGNVQYYPGNTIIAHLSPSTEPELHKSMVALHDKLKSSHLSHLYTLLPVGSLHMTLFEGVLDRVRVPGRWPDDLPLNASLEECTSLFAKKLSSFDLQCDPPYHLSVTGFDPLENGIGVHLEPASTEENARIRGLRDRLWQLLHIRSERHDTYPLHFSMAYLLRILTDEQDKELRALLMDHFEGMPKQFTLGSPEFCTFENMFAFTPLLYLKNQ